MRAFSLPRSSCVATGIATKIAAPASVRISVINHLAHMF